MKPFYSPKIVTLLSLFLLSSCAFLVSRPQKDIKSDSYSISFNHPEWKSMPPDIADYAYNKASSGSLIIANSICKKYDSTSLENLTTNILSGIDNVKIEKEEEITFSERKARRTLFTGSLDGVAIAMILQTVKKNQCIYDFLLISKDSAKRQKDKEEFDRFLKSVNIK